MYVCMYVCSTPLMIAAVMGHTKVLDALIKGKANLLSRNVSRATPLFIAAANGACVRVYVYECTSTSKCVLECVYIYSHTYRCARADVHVQMCMYVCV